MSSKLSSRGQRCPRCQAWFLAIGENYCSACGGLTLAVEIEPEVQIFATSSRPGLERKPFIILSSQSPSKTKVTIRPDSGKPWLRTTQKKFTLSREKRKRVLLEYRPDQLPKGFVGEDVPFHFVFNGNAHSKLTAWVRVKAGPRPRANAVNFGVLQEGEVGRHQILLRNDGGLVYAVREIEVSGSRQVQVGDVTLPIRVLPGARVPIPITWDTTIAEGPPSESATVKFSLGDDSVYAVPLQASIVKYHLEVDPSLIHLEASPRTHPRTQLRITNSGTIDVRITEIRAEAPWLTVRPTARNSRMPRLLKAATTTDGAPSGNQLLLEISVHPGSLEPGDASTRVLLITEPKEYPDLEIDVRCTMHELEPYSDYIGIDFGTTNSVIAVLGADRQPELVQIPSQETKGGKATTSPLIPSLLYFPKDGPPRIGYEAANARVAEAERVVRSIKRVLGYSKEIKVGEHRFSAEDIASLIIKQLVDRATSYLHSVRGKFFDLRNAIITVPADFWDLQIRAILNACEMAGLKVDREAVQQATEIAKERTGQAINADIILSEPSAAALYFLHYLSSERSLGSMLEKKVGDGKGLHLLVYDHGGGTLDVAMAQVKKLKDGSIGLTILATAGGNRLGGDFFDRTLLASLLPSAALQDENFDASLIQASHSDIQQRRHQEDWSENDWSQVSRARWEWREAAETLKIALADGESESAEYQLPGHALCRFEEGRLIRGSGWLTLQMSQDQLTESLSNPLTKCENVVKEALRMAGVEAQHVDYVMHAGRQSLLHPVQKRVANLFKHLTKEHFVLDKERLLKTCVALGAVHFGRMKSLSGSKIRLIQNSILPHSYGIEQSGAFGEAEFFEILPAGESYPLTKEITLENPPESGRYPLRVLQNTGTSRQLAGNSEIRELGLVELEYEPSSKSTLQLSVTLDSQRQLTINSEGRSFIVRPTISPDELDWIG